MECIPALPGTLARGAGILWREWLHGCDELTRSNVVLIEKCTFRCSSVIHHRAEESRISLDRGVSFNANVDRFNCAHLTRFIYSFWFRLTFSFGRRAALLLVPGAQKTLPTTYLGGMSALRKCKSYILFAVLSDEYFCSKWGKCLDGSLLVAFGTTTYGGLFSCSNKTFSNVGRKWATATFSWQLVLFRFLTDFLKVRFSQTAILYNLLKRVEWFLELHSIWFYSGEILSLVSVVRLG